MYFARKVMAIDFIPYEYRARELGCKYFPLKEIKEIFSRDADIIETLVTLVRRIPNDPKNYKDVCELMEGFQTKAHILESFGAKIIECPTKVISLNDSPNIQYKHSDDQRLMVTTLVTCMKLKPDALVLFASDGDYTPMVEALREEGIRTVVVGPQGMVSRDLCRKAVSFIDYDLVVQECISLAEESQKSLP